MVQAKQLLFSGGGSFGTYVWYGRGGGQKVGGSRGGPGRGRCRRRGPEGRRATLLRAPRCCSGEGAALAITTRCVEGEGRGGLVGGA